MSILLTSPLIKTALRSGRKLWQAAFGRGTALERFLRWHYDAMTWRTRGAPRYALFSAGSNPSNRVGIFMKGGCDLPAVFACEPLIRQVLNGTCCMMLEGTAADSRTDLLLQTRRELPKEWIDPVIKKLKLRDDYFQSQLFEKNIILPGKNGLQEFPKSAVILSVGADLGGRSLYAHREHGFLVDPGGWWLNQNLNEVLNDLSGAKWFRENFVSVGRSSLEAFVENLTEIVKLLKNDTSAPILVFNALTVDPGSTVHNYQFIKYHHTMGRRAFNIALKDLSRKLDFSIVDVDRVLKKAGVNAQLDFAHFPAELYPPVAQETFRIMKDLGVFS